MGNVWGLRSKMNPRPETLVPDNCCRNLGFRNCFQMYLAGYLAAFGDLFRAKASWHHMA